MMIRESGLLFWAIL